MVYRSLIVIMICSTSFFASAAPTLTEAVKDHRARVADFYERLEKARRAPKRDEKAIRELNAFREAWARSLEQARAQFAKERKKIDPRLEEIREAAVLAEEKRLEKIKEGERKEFVADRDKIRRAIASERQIDPMVEYDITTDPDRAERKK